MEGYFLTFYIVECIKVTVRVTGLGVAMAKAASEAFSATPNAGSRYWLSPDNSFLAKEAWP
jgi:hypothetical protein